MLALLVAIIGGTGAGLIIWLALNRVLDRSGAQQQQLRRMGVETAIAQKGIPLRHTRYSALPGLRLHMQNFSPTARLAIFLEQAGVNMTVSVFLLLTGCAAFGAYLAAGMMTASLPIRWAAAAGTMLVPWLLLNGKRRGRLRRITAQLPDAIRLMSSALRAGHGFDGGIQIVVNELGDPIKSEFQKLLNEAHLCGDMKVALTHLSRRLPLSDMRLFAASACLHRDVGGNFAILLDRLERTVRDRLQLNREMKTLTAESRVTGWIVGMLPVVVGLGIFLKNPSYFKVLIVTENGRLLFALGIGLELAGFLIIRLLTTPRVN
jgi:tight adherence protein B